MPYDTAPLDLEAEHDRLAERYHEARAVAQDDSESEAAREQAQRAATRAKQHAAAVEWLIDEYGPGARIEVGGLTMGEDAQVVDEVQAAAAAKTNSEAIRGLSRNYTVAAGVATAPFYDDDASTLGDRVAAISDLPRHVGKYLHSQIADRETLDPDLGNG
jgi:hypothetical protein